MLQPLLPVVFPEQSMLWCSSARTFITFKKKHLKEFEYKSSLQELFFLKSSTHKNPDIFLTTSR